MSFSWIFALIVGAMILILAIYFSVKLIDLGGTEKGAKVSKDIGILLNPMETGFEEAKTTLLDVEIESEITNICEDTGIFGNQILTTSQEIFGEQKGGDVEVYFKNKYIFSEKILKGKRFYIFSKKFEFPFKITDLIFIIPEDEIYCFVGAPQEIINYTKEDLKLENIVNVSGVQSCPEKSVSVCFGGGNCKIKVDLSGKHTTKENKKVYFEGDALMYASIFSDPEIYECQLKRVMKRVANLAKLYSEKKEFILNKNCRSIANVEELFARAKSFESSENLRTINLVKEDLEEKNKYAQCKLW